MDFPKRKNTRLPGYDYSQAGGYFVTICTEGRRCILSNVLPANRFARADVRLSELGCIVKEMAVEASRRTGIDVDEWVIMPNHIHLLLRIVASDGTARLGQFVGTLKSLTVYHWRKVCSDRGVQMGKVWQRNYYEHIIRNEVDYMEKLRYLDENPDKWYEDELYAEA